MVGLPLSRYRNSKGSQKVGETIKKLFLLLPPLEFDNSPKIPLRNRDLTSKIVDMASYATTKLSSKGQIVIPEEVRNNLGLKEGDQFIVIGKGDAVILKSISPPSIQQFESLLTQARAEARKAGLKKSHLKAAIAKVRHSRK